MPQFVLTIAIFVGCVTAQLAAQDSDCTPTFAGSHPPAISMYSVLLGTLKQPANNEIVNRQNALQSRINSLRRLLDDHALLLKEIADCFNTCARGDGSVVGNVAFRRCQQGCKNNAIRAIQDYWAKWPETEQGQRVTVMDYGELEILDQYGNESQAAKSSFYVAKQRSEYRESIEEYDAISLSKHEDPEVFMMVPASGPDWQSDQAVRIIFSWLSGGHRNDSLRTNGSVRVLSMTSGSASTNNMIDTRLGTYFETPSNDGTHGMLLISIPKSEARRFLQSIVSRRRLAFDSNSKLAGELTIDLKEESIGVLECVLRMFER